MTLLKTNLANSSDPVVVTPSPGYKIRFLTVSTDVESYALVIEALARRQLWNPRCRVGRGRRGGGEGVAMRIYPSSSIQWSLTWRRKGSRPKATRRNRWNSRRRCLRRRGPEQDRAGGFQDKGWACWIVGEGAEGWYRGGRASAVSGVEDTESEGDPGEAWGGGTRDVDLDEQGPGGVEGWSCTVPS